MSFHVPEKFRVTKGRRASNSEDGNNGAFIMPSFLGGRILCIIASDGMGWEHVSVRVSSGKKSRTPTW